MSADRNLLFGILAVQSGFCTGPQLVEAMNAWTLAKERPLGEILVERGFLQKDEHDLLTALVAKQLSKHGGDVDKSLASLTPIPRLRAELHRIGDPDVEQSLAALPSSQAGDPDHTRTHETSSTGEAVRYRILRPHARGGLGEVFVARDEELGREVALKEIQSTHAHDPNSRGRFVREAEVTGGLEHPGVVAVYGLGSYADGRPFYAMRFIQGDSLKEAIERFHKAGKPNFAGSEFRQLLGRFIDVCQAIAYAHSRGVLHRDLKPGNIMLGKFGETLVVDWGLAKVVGTKEVEHGDRTLNISSGSSSTPTVQGEAIGTPAFMSPEQATGKLDELGPATDVYSLGATLYALLANRPPIESDGIAEALRKAERGEWTPLRSVNPAIPAPLASICANAMATKPADRYSSAQALAADVERHLADEPVSAHRDPFSVRAGRWARKHRTAVTTTLAALLVGAVAMGIGLAVVGDRNVKLAAAKKEADDKRTKAESATKLADERFVLALDSIKMLVFEVQSKLENRPGMKPLRESLLHEAKKRLKMLTKDIDHGEASRASFGIHLSLGDIAYHIDGRTDLASKEYEQALQLAESRVNADSSDVRARQDVWSSSNYLGDVAMRQGNPTMARQRYDYALLVMKRLADSNPDDATFQRGLSTSYERLGVAMEANNDLSAARTFFQNGMEIKKRLAYAEPSNRVAQREFAIFLGHLGGLSLKQNEFSSARRFFEGALQIDEKLAKSDPNDVEGRRGLAISLGRLGDLAQSQRDLQTARRFYEEELATVKRLAQEDQQDARAERDYWISLERVGETALLLEDWAAARRFFEEAAAIIERRAKADPLNVETQRSLPQVLGKLGDATLRQNDLATARRIFKRATEESQRLAQASTHTVEDLRMLWKSKIRLGDLSLKESNPADAREAYIHAKEVALELVRASPSAVDDQRALLNSRWNLGEAEFRLGNFDVAAAQFRDAISQVGDPPKQEVFVEDVRELGEMRAKAERMAEVMANPIRAMTLPPDQWQMALATRQLWLARRNDAIGLQKTAEVFDEIFKKRNDRSIPYNASCAWALTWRAANTDKSLPDAERQKLLRESKTNALDRLRLAVKFGYSNESFTNSDPDLAELRSWPEYVQILAGIKANAANYNAGQPSSTPKAKQ